MTKSTRPSNPHADWRRRIRANRRAREKLADLDAERVALYIEARELDPPVTFAEIAEIVGLSQAAVVQAVERERKRRAADE